MAATTATKSKLDAVLLAAQDQARQAAEEQAGDWGVGEWIGAEANSDLTLTHSFACPHPGYVGWRWTVTMARVPRARSGTITEVDLLPGDTSLLAPAWVPWSQRLQPGDVRPGMVLPTPENDPRLEPGFTGGELAADEDPAEWAATRVVVAELGLGRERVLSDYGRTTAASRWIRQGGPDDQSSRLAPGECVACGYFVRLAGALGNVFGVCANEYSPSDGRVVSVDHGCGGHSDIVIESSGDTDMPAPVFDTISIDHPIFD
ncbi:MAG: DUF3027 domain-containing protein [Propionibacteriaceae bacterium]|nr:DUF3027 domain-containing protein [Propionibacteriaceae bacterium]